LASSLQALDAMSKLDCTTLCLVAALVGCGQSVAAGAISALPPTSFATASERTFFALSDARTIGFFFAMRNPATGDGGLSSTCASQTADGSTTVFTANGCTSGTRQQSGVVRLTGDPVTGPEFRVEYINWRERSATRCSGSAATVATESTTRGTVHVTARGAIREFEVDLLFEQTKVDERACTGVVETLAINYRGTLDFFGPTGASRDMSSAVRASGSGQVAYTPVGRADTTTAGLVFDPAVCASEPASGTLSLRAGSHTSLLTYDGATRCGTGSNRTAPLSVDGVSVGEVAVNACSVRGAAGRGRVGLAGLFALALGAAGVARRRRGR
jgi:hypothetical protein